jgi:cystathionine beta-lyase/cystathionine gamma-synthase
MPENTRYRDRSVLIHGKFKSEKWDFHDHILPPISTSVAFRLRTADRGAQGFKQFANPELDREKVHPIYVYQRFDEPCQGLLEETLAFAEKGECAVSFATGMAAISAVLGVHCKAGDHILAHKTLYGATYKLITGWFQRFGVESTLCDFCDPESIKASIRPNTRVVYFETPCNPTLELIDIDSVVKVVKQANEGRPDGEKAVTVVDNTFATPFCQRPITLGVDFVVHSLTKNLAGFGADMGGVVVGPRSSETNVLRYRADFGGSISPRAAWEIMTFGIPTLSLRLERQQQNAMEVARFLETQPKVSKVLYPGLDSFPQKELACRQMRDFDGNFAPGSMVYFELGGGPEEAYSRSVKMSDYLASNSFAITLAVSLGQIRTLIEHPASMTHSGVPADKQIEAGMSPGGIRLSLGIEDVRDIVADLGAALDSA